MGIVVFLLFYPKHLMLEGEISSAGFIGTYLIYIMFILAIGFLEIWRALEGEEKDEL